MAEFPELVLPDANVENTDVIDVPPNEIPDNGIEELATAIFSLPPSLSFVDGIDFNIAGVNCANIGSVDPIELGNEPTFTDEQPSIKTIDKPQHLDAASPVSPVLNDRQFPSAPAKEIPLAPTLQSLTLPEIPVLNDIAFDRLEDITLDNPPDIEFDYKEDSYSTKLLIALNDKLISHVQGFSTGLDSGLLSGIWNKGAARELCVSNGLVGDIDRQWTSMGWDDKDTEKREEALQNLANNQLTHSRDVDVSEAMLEQQNFNSAFINAIQLESQLLSNTSQLKQRELDAAIYTVQAVIDIYTLKITSFEALIQAYEIKGKVFSAEIAAALANIRISRSSLEAQSLVNEINNKDMNKILNLTFLPYMFGRS